MSVPNDQTQKYARSNSCGCIVDIPNDDQKLNAVRSDRSGCSAAFSSNESLPASVFQRQVSQFASKIERHMRPKADLKRHFSQSGFSQNESFPASMFERRMRPSPNLKRHFSQFDIPNVDQKLNAVRSDRSGRSAGVSQNESLPASMSERRTRPTADLKRHFSQFAFSSNEPLQSSVFQRHFFQFGFSHNESLRASMFERPMRLTANLKRYFSQFGFSQNESLPASMLERRMHPTADLKLHFSQFDMSVHNDAQKVKDVRCDSYGPNVDNQHNESPPKLLQTYSTTGLDNIVYDGDEDWAYFNHFRNKKVVKRLLENGTLPKQRTLDEICLLFGRKSKLTLRICKVICEHIKSKHNSIINVWAAYTLEDPNKITFVVCLKKEENTEDTDKDKSKRLHKIIEYSFIKRIIGEYSHEGTEIMNNNVSSEKDIDDYAYSTLKDCVAKYSVELMKKHKYLSIISASSKRSIGYGSRWNMKQENCIVLYVHTKHYIPVDEEPFKTHYDGIPIDVREGTFIPFGKTATDFLEHVKMGSQIRGEVENGKHVEGTLGCFVDHPQYGVCGLTCAHVLLRSEELTSLKSQHNGSFNWPLHDMCKNVYQPANQTNDIGHTVQLIYKEGSGGCSGMDVALFKLTSRHPTSSEFPNASSTVYTTTRNINYKHWRICSAERLNSKMKQVVKFGSKTELRDGNIEFSTIAVKWLDDFPLTFGDTIIKLHKQIEVKPKIPGVLFADIGDSGALVFLVGDNNSEHTCIGIVEGGTSYGTAVVSPIVPILEELKVSGLKSFDSEQDLYQVHGRIETVGNYLNRELLTMKNEVQTVGSEVQRISGDMQTVGTEMQRISGDMQTVETEVQRISGEVQTVGTEVQRISGDMQTVGTEIQRMSGDIQTIRSDIHGLQTMGSTVQQIQQMLIALLPANQSPTSPNT